MKGNLQGVTKNKATTIFPHVSKAYFLKQFKSLLIEMSANRSDLEAINKLSYNDAKTLANSYGKALCEFHSIYSDWLKIDKTKYYSFI